MMRSAEIKPMAVVKSLAGRDCGEWFVVLALDEDFATIANGKSRPLCRPKRKRRKHLATTATVLARESAATDRSLRAALRAFAADCDKEGNDLG